MAGGPGQAHLESLLRRNGGDDAEGQAFSLQDRPLFDMGFEKGQHLARRPRGPGDRGAVATGERSQGLAQADALGVAHGQDGGIDRARHRPAAGHGRGKARALLVAERDRFDGEVEPPPGPGQGLHAIDPQHHAQGAVIAAAVAHSVDVRADHQGRGAGRLRLIAADQVGGGVAPHAHAGRAHPFAQGFQRRAVRWGQEPADELIGLLAIGRRAHQVAARHGPGAEVVHPGHHGARPGADGGSTTAKFATPIHPFIAETSSPPRPPRAS